MSCEFYKGYDLTELPDGTVIVSRPFNRPGFTVPEMGVVQIAPSLEAARIWIDSQGAAA